MTYNDQLLQYLYEHPEQRVALDTETNGLRVDDGRHQAIGISMAFRVPETGKMAKAYWGINHRVGENVDADTVKKLRYILVKQRRGIIYANAQFDMLALETIGMNVRANPFWDVLTIQNLIDENWTRGRRGLDELSVYHDVGTKVHEWEYARYVEGRKTPLEKTTLKWQKENGWPHTTPEMMDHYASVDALQTWLISEKQFESSEWHELPSDCWDNKRETILVLTELRCRGVRLDLDLVQQLHDEGERAKAKVIEVLGLNPASHKDMKELFIERLQMPILKKSEKTGEPSFDKTVMPEYDMILERDGRDEAKFYRVYQGWKTAVGLLLGPYLKLVSPDGRLRTEYTTHVTATGRLSSRNPNLQQISKGSNPAPWNDRITKCFIPKDGYTLLSADYSQLELRLATAYSQEPELLKIFEEGRDIFTEMTEALVEQFRQAGNNRLADGWTRYKTKTMTYSIQYGGGVGRIKNAFGVSEREAKQIINSFYRTYRRFRALDDLCKKRVKESLRLKLWSGRFRHFKYPGENYKAMNSLCQGGAADIVERVMVRAMKELDNEDCRMLLQVHDALVFEVRTEMVDEYKVRIEELMEDVNGICDPDGVEPLFPVKFAVEVTVW